ncbi:hypothetical protein [Aeromicrobium wangtongii]|uniref:Lipoprotein n=1 Tax=Aeromicrobium wangtongii TaxID=2969247 RepID=A0ABY5M942_9ACTN|nr:hypothetical protein [Aeromicrobium wangtongii]MCD9199892.1 hypothetical protein [Aeromicrobium wangtongii]UUP13510.1 hypothetical protein NQV15_16920 [Aeromicrobium wangtongii]
MRWRAVVLLLGAVLTLGGCQTDGSDGQKRADYTPVPDETLFSAIRALPGVERADLSYNDTWPAHSYLATITLSPNADAQLVLDTVYAKLWQGRLGADITLEAQQGGQVVRLDAFGGQPSSRAALKKRYGPQPGDGTPPGDG